MSQSLKLTKKRWGFDKLATLFFRTIVDQHFSNTLDNRTVTSGTLNTFSDGQTLELLESRLK